MSEDGPLVDLTTRSDDDFRLWLDGYQTGRIHGREDEQREQWEREAAVWQHAVRNARSGLNEPPRDRQADEARASLSAAWWAAQRGEVA